MEMLSYRDMNIVHVAPQLAGGVASVIEQLSREQLRLGANVVVVHPRSQDVRFNGEGLDVLECPARRIPGGTMLLGVPYWIAMAAEPAGRVTLVHYHGLAAQGCLGRDRFPSVCTLHGVSALANLSPVRTALVRMGFRMNTVFIAVDSATASYFSSFCPSDIEVIPNGLPPLPGEMATKGHPVPVITFIGNLDELKGYRYALEAAKLLYTAGLRFKMLLAGPASDEERSYLDGFCERYSLQACIEYLGVVRDAGATLVPASDIILLPSRTEGFPMSLLEALRAGKAVLATRVGGIPELLHDGENGFFVERDGVDIAEKAGQLLRNPALLEAFSNKSKAMFEERFRIEDVCGRYAAVYSQAIATFGGRRL